MEYLNGQIFSPSVKTILARTAKTINAGDLTFDIAFPSTPGVRVTRYILECPNTLGGGTMTLSFIDVNSIPVFTGAAHAENTNPSIPIDVELIGAYTLRLTLSVVAGDVTTAHLTLQGY